MHFHECEPVVNVRLRPDFMNEKVIYDFGKLSLAATYLTTPYVNRLVLLGPPALLQMWSCVYISPSQLDSAN